MVRKGILLLLGLAVVVVGVGFMMAQERTGKDSKREADRRAVDQLTKDFLLAYDNRDAAAVAANWTDEGEFVRNDGEAIHGRAAIQKGYEQFFKSLRGKPRMEIQVDSLRFPSTDTAVSEVTLRLKNDEGEVIASSWRNTLLVREDGKWKVALAREWDRDVGLDVSLKELEWLVGTWYAAGKDRQVMTTYEWNENKTFIRGKYAVKEGDKVIESGTQMIGKDNAEGAIRSWVFQADGGFGGGVWTRDGQKWSVDFYGVTSEGRELTATTMYVRVDPNSYTWQAVGQAIDGAPVADTVPIKVIRQKAPK